MSGADPSNLSSLISVLIGSFELIGKAISFGKKVGRGFSNEGIYEVLEFENTLEILNKSGTKAKIKKRMLVKYLQDNILSFTDFAWTNGKGPLNYRISPGVPVDEYKSGYRTNILISLRERRNRSDTDEFNIEWEIHSGFLKSDAFWQIDIAHKFDSLKFQLILPEGRQPSGVFIEEINRKKTTKLQNEHIQKLPDGRWSVTWKHASPALYESYIVHWTW
jgi:hypothetical protein